jgi:NDP-sugar pyrophosphorylase family protein
MLLRRNEEAERFGIVATDTTGRVVRLVDLAKAQAQGLVDESTHFTGIHALSRQVLDDLPPGFSCIVRTAYTRLVPTRSVAGLDLVENNAATIGRWFDIGNPQDYLEANRAVLRGSLSLPHDPRPEAARWLDTGEESGQWLGPIWIGEGAVVHPSARLGPDVVIGANATIGANAQLRDSVVWDGVQVASGARLRRCVAHDSGVLHVAD